MNNNLPGGWNDLVILYVNQKYFRREFSLILHKWSASFKYTHSDVKMKCALSKSFTVCAGRDRDELGDRVDDSLVWH